MGPLGLCFGCGCCQEGHGEWEVLPQEWLTLALAQCSGVTRLGAGGAEHRSVRVYSSEQGELVSL